MMRTTPTMQKIITRIVKKNCCPIPLIQSERRLFLQLEGLPPLHLVISPDYVSVSQIEQESGEFYCDPEVLFYTGGRGWVPIHARRMGVLDETYAKPNWKIGGISPVPGEEVRQGEQAQKCERWAQELQAQGWLERATRPHA